MHRTVTSDDVLRFPNDISPRDIQFHEEDDIEYRDGRLIKSNGTVHLSLDKSVTIQETDGQSDIVTIHGHFYLQLLDCRDIPSDYRSRRAIQSDLESTSSLEETLMASVDESYISLYLI